MEITLSKNDVVPQLWSAYQKTQEYKNGAKFAMPANHFLVEKQEKYGLGLIYKQFVYTWAQHYNIEQEIKNRTVGDWLREWKEMHNLLFSSVLKDRGKFRTNLVYFGNVGDEQIYKIPQPYDINRELSELGFGLHKVLQSSTDSMDAMLKNLAKIHYGFIRIHPFSDGNGRIARAITDQLALYYGLPVAMVGFPRHSSDSRSTYHKAIRSCVDDPACTQLADWIRGFIEKQLETLA